MTDIAPYLSAFSFGKYIKFDGYKYSLTKNIKWPSIQGYYTLNIPNKMFDGCGHTITCTGSSAGIFAGDNVIIENLTIKSIVIDNGGFVYSGANYLIKNCVHKGDIIGNLSGGFVGNSASSGKIINCKNIGNISYNTDRTGAGGICGSVNSISSVIIEHCVHYGNVSMTGSGGIAGKYFSGNIYKCHSKGNVNGYKSGGICGSNGILVNIKYCYHIGNIKGDEAGGIVGSSFGMSTTMGYSIITKCYHKGNIEGSESGGIAGSYCAINVNDNNPRYGLVNVNNCFVTGDILGSESGGITGSYSAYDGAVVNNSYNVILIIDNCYFNGNIEGNNSGGICGTHSCSSLGNYFPSYLTISNCYVVGNMNQSTGGICSIPFNGTTNGDTNISITDCYVNSIVPNLSKGIILFNTYEHIDLNNCYSTDAQDTDKLLSSIHKHIDQLNSNYWKLIKNYEYPVLRNFLNYPWKGYKGDNKDLKLKN